MSLNEPTNQREVLLQAYQAVGDLSKPETVKRIQEDPDCDAIIYALAGLASVHQGKHPLIEEVARIRCSGPHAETFATIVLKYFLGGDKELEWENIPSAVQELFPVLFSKFNNPDEAEYFYNYILQKAPTHSAEQWATAHPSAFLQSLHEGLLNIDLTTWGAVPRIRLFRHEILNIADPDYRRIDQVLLHGTTPTQLALWWPKIQEPLGELLRQLETIIEEEDISAARADGARKPIQSLLTQLATLHLKNKITAANSKRSCYTA